MNAALPVITPIPDETIRISPSALAPDPTQDRKFFDDAELQELADNLSVIGLIQPIVARPPFQDEAVEAHQLLIIIAGERRWRASQRAGLVDVPVIIKRGLTPVDVIAMQAVENLQRSKLTLSEESTLCKRLVDAVGMDGALTRISKSKSWVSKRAGVAAAPEEIRRLVEAGTVRDVEIANSLAQLHEVDLDTFRTVIQDFYQPDDDGETPSRAYVANAVKMARHVKEQAAKQAEPLKEIVTPARDKAGAGKAALSAQELRAAEIDTLEPKIRAFEKDAQTLIENALGLVPDATAEGDEDPVEVSGPWLNRWDNSPLPADVDAAQFRLRITACAGKFERLDESFSDLRLGVELENLTLDQARAIEKIIGKPAQFVFAGGSTGDAIGAIVRALNSDPAAHLTRWIDEHLKPEPGSRVKSSEAHAAYVQACETHGVDAVPLSGRDNQWALALHAAGIEIKRSDGMRLLDVALA